MADPLVTAAAVAALEATERAVRLSLCAHGRACGPCADLSVLLCVALSGQQVALSLATGSAASGDAALPDGFYAELLAAYLADGDLYVSLFLCACLTRSCWS